jgi:hypothetical protein
MEMKTDIHDLIDAEKHALKARHDQQQRIIFQNHHEQ